jgi:hypothetical protein
MPPKETVSDLTLLISNQSFDINPVDIEIKIDGEVVVKDNFNVQQGQLSQHNWQQYHLQLSRGSHQLVATSKKGKAQLQTELKIEAAQTSMIAYWKNQSKNQKQKAHFTIENTTRSFGLM